MNAVRNSLWDRYRSCLWDADLGLTLDLSRIRSTSESIADISQNIWSALDAMASLEAGGIANQDENRMVGHYWLREPELAPSSEIGMNIRQSIADVIGFAEIAHRGLSRKGGTPTKHVIHVGIGGSSLGAQFICNALQTKNDFVTLHFLDNADPDSLSSLIESLAGGLDQTIVSVVSKSGVTPTPKYVLRELETVFKSNGLDFSRHAVATTMPGTDLDELAKKDNWLARFPLWDWVGGRTSVTSSVGLLPAAFQGIDVTSFLSGAAAMDRVTRLRAPLQNPAAQLALAWYWLGNGHGRRNMVVVPYRDRLALFPRYVQQLMMESIGKKFDKNGTPVAQGLTVYGNKGCTDQHSYFQQLREGPDDFFVLFIGVNNDQYELDHQRNQEITLGDYLFFSLEGTRKALYESGRNSITITLRDISPKSLGCLIALFERAVGIYAELINVNAYNQPGVDKYVADGIVKLRQLVLSHLRDSVAQKTAEEIAHDLGQEEQTEIIFKILERMARERRQGVRSVGGPNPFEARYFIDHEHLNIGVEGIDR